MRPDGGEEARGNGFIGPGLVHDCTVDVCCWRIHAFFLSRTEAGGEACCCLFHGVHDGFICFKFMLLVRE